MHGKFAILLKAVGATSVENHARPRPKAQNLSTADRPQESSAKEIAGALLPALAKATRQEGHLQIDRHTSYRTNSGSRRAPATSRTTR
eukprot:5476353-Pleurochrysis_carterae.AAC.1